MCAIFGFFNYGNKISHKILTKLLRELSIAAEVRGTDATGISYVKDGKMVTFKKAKPAHKVNLYFPKGTTTVIGHTRFTTQGSEKQNYNNHPFEGRTDSQTFSLAHNGVLYNDKELKKKYNLPETKIETDSYVAVQLIEQQKKLDFESLKNMAETVQGSFNFTILDENNSLYIVKGSNPMFLIHFEELGLYVYASTESIMTNALKKVGMQNIPYTIIKTVHGDILKIDINGNISHSEFEETDNFFNPYTYCHYNDLWDYSEDDDCISDLLMVCGLYGVDSEDVKLLLEYGYTADEIEDLLFDSNLFEETINAIKLEM